MLQQSNEIKPFNVSETMYNRNHSLRGKFPLNDGLHNGFRVPIHTETYATDISTWINSDL